MDHMDLISRNSDDGSINLADPRILTAETSQKDNLHLGKAMKSDDREDFMVIPKSSLPTSAHIIRLLWSFKRKRNPSGEIIKHKAHVFEHGGMIDFNNTFAPVVNWSTVRFIIMMAEIAGWETGQIDYVLDFSKAPIDSGPNRRG